MALLFNINFCFDCKIRLCLIVPGRHEKIYICTIKFISTRHTQCEHDTSFLDRKHKHMMKCGAPPDKCGVKLLYIYLSNSMVSQAEIILRGITLLFLVLSQFLETVWVPLIDHLLENRPNNIYNQILSLNIICSKSTTTCTTR